jgi:hypothetical protein
MERSGTGALALGLLVLAQGCRPTERAAPAPSSPPVLQRMSLAQVLANPKPYDGKRVRVVGFCHFEFEGDALYVQGTNYFQRITKHAIWLDVEQDPRVLALSDDYVIVEGRFEADTVGIYAGSLREISYLEGTSPL